MNINYHFDYPCLMYSELPEDIFEELNNLPNGAHHGNKLVGVFPDEYKLPIRKAPLFREYIICLSEAFARECSTAPVFHQIRQNTPPNTPFKLADLWRNEMYANAYQPLHQHTGLFSFIVYMDVPYTHADQIKLEPNVLPEHVKNGFTEFSDPFSMFNKLINVEKGIEGQVILFPAWVNHVVYPFKGFSGIPRVSISGNIVLDYGTVDGAEHF